MTRSAAPVTLTGKPKNVAEYLSWQISLSGKTNLQIAEEVGFAKPNVISMIKNGTTPVPIERIGAIAKSLGIDPVHLFKMCMEEYDQKAIRNGRNGVGTWKAIEGIVGQPVLTDNEMEIINFIRECEVENPKLRTDEERQRMAAVINSLKSDNVVR